MTTFKKLSQKLQMINPGILLEFTKNKLDHKKGPNWVQSQQKNTQWDLMERELRLLKNFHSLG